MPLRESQQRGCAKQVGRWTCRRPRRQRASLLFPSPHSTGWVWQRKIAFVKMGRALRFEQAVLRDFIEQNRVAVEANKFSIPWPYQLLQ